MHNFTFVLVSLGLLFSLESFADTKKLDPKPSAQNVSNEVGPKSKIQNLDCGLLQLKDWRDHIKVEKTPQVLKKIEIMGKEEADNQRFIMTKLGEVTTGKCKGFEIVYISAIFDFACGKSSGTPMELLADGTEFYDEMGMESWFDARQVVKRIDDPCLGEFVALKKGDEIYPNEKHLSEDFSSLFTKMKLPYSTIESEPMFHGLVSKEFEFQYNGIKQKGVREDKELAIKSDLLTGKLKLLYSDSIIGEVFAHGRFGYIVTPDSLVYPADLGLSFKKDGYKFAGFLSDLKKLNLDSSDLVDSKKEIGWKEVDPKNEKFFQKMYKEFQERAKKFLSQEHYELEESSIKISSFKDYMKDIPLLFKKDYLGRIQVLAATRYRMQSMVEPLVYVYSEKPTDIKISLCDDLKLIAAEPNYSGAWDLQTIPPNRVRVRGEKRSFRYLFWEGTADSHFPEMDSGWVIEREKIEDFFEDTLSKLGLNDRERIDFKEYWVELLEREGFPFYKIEFFPQKIVDKICPLQIEPKPDTYLRVHMRATGISEKVKISEPVLPNVSSRKGLTVIEWGGLTY